MKNRIMAIASLVLFLFVLTNIFVFKQYDGPFVIIYVVIVIVFILFFSNKNKNKQNQTVAENLEKEYMSTEKIRIENGFDKEIITYTIKKDNLLKELHQNSVDVKLSEDEIIKNAINNPIGSDRLRNIVKPGEKIVIVTSDITRPMPSNKVLPHVINEIEESGVNANDITIVLALGSHRKHTEKEKEMLVGKEIFEKVNVIDSDMEDYVHLGETKYGTPIDIFTPVTEADRIICMGNVEYHYFAGYSGGAKAIMPGVSTRQAIQSNHSKMVMDEAKAGNIDTNPVRLDIEDVANTVKIDYILNVVLDDHKKIIGCFCGDYIKAHRAGCSFLDKVYRIEIPEKADIVITTPGGFPKDINLYQAQKALDNSKHAVKDNGVIILLASCHEGYGEETFSDWLLGATKPDDLIERIQKEFKLGGHKAAAIAMVAKKADIYAVSSLDDNKIKKAFMTPFDSMESALESAFKKMGNDAKIIIMPHGGSTLPYVAKDMEDINE